MFYSFFPGPINKRSKALSSDIFTLFPSFLLLGRNNSRRFGKARLFGISVNRVVEFPGAGLGRLITINSELNGAI